MGFVLFLLGFLDSFVNFFFLVEVKFLYLCQLPRTSGKKNLTSAASIWTVFLCVGNSLSLLRSTRKRKWLLCSLFLYSLLFFFFFIHIIFMFIIATFFKAPFYSFLLLSMLLK